MNKTNNHFTHTHTKKTAQITELENDFSKIHNEMKSSSDKFEKNCLELQDAMEKTTILDTKLSEMPKQIALHDTQHCKLVKKVSELKGDLSKAKKYAAEQISELELRVKNFERLGLRFVRVEDGSTLKIAFTQIDASEPCREFSVGLQINDDDEYEVTECEPTVESLPRLIKDLNMTNDFAKFVKCVRKSFKDLC